MKWDRRGHVVTGALLITLCAAAPSDAAPRISRQKEKTMEDNHGSFTLTLSCDRDYLAGFPLLVAVDLRNVSTSFVLLRPVDLFNAPGPVGFVLRGGGHEWVWPRSTPQLEGEPEGEEFGPGKAWLALQDLSELHPDLPPGHYELSASALFPGEMARSAPVPIEIRASSHQDRAGAAKLRATNDAGESSWRAFVRDNWSTPDATHMSPSARAHLAYYLYLHKVAYGPKPVAALDPEEPWRFGHGVLESEAAVGRLEILVAARRPEAKGVEAAVLERWPGLAWRVEDIHRSAGFLTVLRTWLGVERNNAPTDKPRPYHP